MYIQSLSDKKNKNDLLLKKKKNHHREGTFLPDIRIHLEAEVIKTG